MSDSSDKPLICRALLDVIKPANVLVRLDQLTAVRSAASSRRRRPPEHVHANASSVDGGVHVAILERMTTRTMTVRWSDPLSGSYGEQLWRRSRSRYRSRCSLSGLPIGPGDAVFKPACYGCRTPFNQHRMILATQAELALGSMDAAPVG
jgi:hypothetical protein